MTSHIWQYQLDDDHFYDLRSLPVGGWAASSITCTSYGPWFTFSHPSRASPFNPTRRVQPDVRRAPPGDFGAVATGYSLPVPPSTDPVFTMTPRALDAINEEAVRRHPPVSPEGHTVAKPPRANTSGNLYCRSLKSGGRRAGAAPRARAAAPLNHIVLGSAELPDREREFDRRVGTDPSRPPFRVSQIEIRRHFRSTVDATRPHSEIATTNRPAASTVDRVPFVVAMYGDAERSEGGSELT
jgi:hypothetical protein